MPTRYTLAQVVTIFESKKCILFRFKIYQSVLNYIAICGHPNIVDLKTFLQGNGLKCRACALGYTYILNCYEIVFG